MDVPLERHDRNLTGNGEFGLGRCNDLRRGHAGRRLNKRRAAVTEGDHRHFGHNHFYRA